MRATDRVDAVKHREHGHCHVVAGQVIASGHAISGGAVVMVDHVALGLLGSARGEVEIEQIIFLDFNLRLTGRRACRQRLVITAQHVAFAETGAMRDLKKIAQIRHQRRASTRAFPRGQAVVQRQGHHAVFGQREVDLDHFHALAVKERHPVALAQAEIGKSTGQAIATLIGLAKSEAALAGSAVEGFLLGESNCRTGENLTDDHFAHCMTAIELRLASLILS
ncbi:hypothetical protein D9M71_628790 [compost metagenome]